MMNVVLIYKLKDDIRLIMPEKLVNIFFKKNLNLEYFLKRLLLLKTQVFMNSLNVEKKMDIANI